jgi:enterochelin esterase-like enzyme
MVHLEPRVLILVVIVVIRLVNVTDIAVAECVGEDKYDSPRLAQLAKELNAAGQTAIEKFWEEMRSKAPLIEPIGGDAGHSWVTFVWRGDDETRTVNVIGGPPSTMEESAKWLNRLGDSYVWYRTERVPNDARFTYGFEINRPNQLPYDFAGRIQIFTKIRRTDPLNAREGLVELPNAPQQSWIQRLPGVPEGAIRERRMKSVILKQERRFVVYTPPNYSATGEPYGLIVFFDGEAYRRDGAIPGPRILDNLIAQKKIPPLVAVFVEQTAARQEELACSQPFGDFVAFELVPWIRKRYEVTSAANRTIICGLSYGGLMAAYCSFRYPEVFGNVLSQSGSFGWCPETIDLYAPFEADTGWLIRQYVSARRSEVTFFLEVGRFETDTVKENRRFRDVLQAKGYDVQYREINGDHEHAHWRGTLADGLIALTKSVR